MWRDRSLGKRRISFCINDHTDILVEVLKRLDGRSLSVAACVCRLWSAVASTDSIWEYLCFRHVSPLPSSSGIRSVVSALGGYRRLYMICVRPVHSRLRGPSRLAAAWSRVELVQLSLSLFCVDYYERLGPPTSPTRFGDVSGSSSSSSSSLMFLCNPVNV